MIAASFNPGGTFKAYSRALGELAALTGFNQRAVLLAEAGVILKTWAGRTPVSTVDAASRGARARALRTITYRGKASPDAGYMTINSGRRGGTPGWMWHRTARGKFQTAGLMNLRSGGFRWANMHFPDNDWAEMQGAAAKAGEALRTMVPGAVRSIGLSRQSVLQIADALGIDLLQVKGGGNLSDAGILKARAALASSGRAYRNGFGYQGGTRTTDFVQLINQLPHGTKIGMDQTLYSIVQGRVGFFEKNFAKGVFASQKNIARAYPNLLKVSTPA